MLKIQFCPHSFALSSLRKALPAALRGTSSMNSMATVCEAALA